MLPKVDYILIASLLQESQMSVGTRNQNDAETLFHVQARKWKFAAKAVCGIGSEFRRIWYGMNCLATDSSFFMRRPENSKRPSGAGKNL